MFRLGGVCMESVIVCQGLKDEVEDIDASVRFRL